MVMAAIFIFRIVPWKDPGSIRPLAIFLMSLGGQRTNSCMFYIFYPKSIQTLASRCLAPICSRLQRKNTHTNTRRKHLIRKPDRGIVRDWGCQGIGANSYTFMLPWLHSEICGCSSGKQTRTGDLCVQLLTLIQYRVHLKPLTVNKKLPWQWHSIQLAHFRSWKRMQ